MVLMAARDIQYAAMHGQECSHSDDDNCGNSNTSSSPDPSSPSMWPHPPERGESPPDGFSNWQFDPVPEMTTIPPVETSQQ